MEEAQLAVLSMGCFWKTEADLGGLAGVYATDVGECPVVHGYVCVRADAGQQGTLLV